MPWRGRLRLSVSTCPYRIGWPGVASALKRQTRAQSLRQGTDYLVRMGAAADANFIDERIERRISIVLLLIVWWQNRRAAGLQVAYAREENAAILVNCETGGTSSFFPRRAINFFSRMKLKTRRRFPKTASGLPDRTQDLPAGDLRSKP
jgi:hypothetical protein